MNQELANYKKNELGPVGNFSFGTENIITQDIRLPKILLMQQMSEFCSDDRIQARPGELRESFEGQKLGDKANPLKIIPFYFTNTWTVKKEENGKMVFARTEVRTGADIQREYETFENGVKHTNHRTLNIFALIKGGNLSVPYMISLMNKSFTEAAQPFLNKAQLLKAEGKAPAFITWALASDITENDKGKFYYFTLEAVKENGKDVYNTQEELQYAQKAYQSMTNQLSQGAKIDMSDLEEAPY